MILLLALCTFTTTTFAQDGRDSEAYKKGETIFKGNCASCHNVHKDVTGPALAGVYDKHDREWLYAWIKNSSALIKAGDPTAVKLFNDWNQTPMTAMPLTNDEIDIVLDYIKVETENPPVAVVENAAAGGGETSSHMTIFMGIVMAILLIIVFALSQVSGTLNRLVKERMGQLVPEAEPLERRIFNKKMMALMSLGLLIFLGYSTVDSAARLGRQQNYQPDQPIKFSHALHAGVNKIECQYCHSGAANGKSAVIPSPNVCMNCHKAINEGPTYGKAEIQKIYDAVGWDAEKKKYTENAETKPIEWVRIHNLPDHVYFNHSQHVNAGGVECQTCHGPIEEMEVVKQHSSLGMGWCINCHRETEVNFQGNDYYKVYEDYHDKLKSGDMKKVTVEDIGGLECQKCHY